MKTLPPFDRNHVMLLLVLFQLLNSTLAFTIGRTIYRTTTMTTATTAHSAVSAPLAEHGEWQAYFDDDRYCLVYYFNTVTGASQWEPPPNFPIPAVRSMAQTKRVTTASSNSDALQHHHQQQKQTREVAKLETNNKEKSKSENSESPLGWLMRGAFQAATSFIEKQQQESERQKKAEEEDNASANKPWWSFLVDDDEEEVTATTSSPQKSTAAETAPQESFWDRWFSRTKANKKQDTAPVTISDIPPATTIPTATMDHRHHHTTATTTDPRRSMRTLQQQHTEWLKFMNDSNDDTSPTFPLVPPSEREAKLQEKLYADSLARQENLRRNYKAVQEHRSRTFSLSALKRENPHAKEWHQYLGD